MALLRIITGMGPGRPCWRAILALLTLLICPLIASTQVQPVREYQIKAVFLFNFPQFVEWPPEAFPDANSPMIIGVLGEDPFGKILDETVQGEQIASRPL
jgi:hypothetical protein